MNNYQVIVARVMVALLAIINALAGMNIGLPSFADAQGVNLLNAAVLAVGAAIQYAITKPVAPVPTDPVV